MKSQNKGFLSEINVIRGIACIAVVVMHSVNKNNYSGILPEIEKLSLFATPLFLFLASFLMFYSYRDHAPKGFLRKRVQYILIPYILWSIIYSMESSFSRKHQWPKFEEVIHNIVTGQFHIYFILIIFQFYLLFIMIQRDWWKKKLRSGILLLPLFLFNVGYLYVFTYMDSPTESLNMFWKRYNYLVFPAWSFYFVLGAFLAYRYEAFKAWIVRYKALIYGFGILAGIFVLSTVGAPVTSKRPEIVIYTVSILLVLFLISIRINGNIPLLSFISRYSFGIYLSHPLFYKVFSDLFLDVSPWFFFTLSFLLQFGGGLLLTMLISKLPYGDLLLGKQQKTAKKMETLKRQIVPSYQTQA